MVICHHHSIQKCLLVLCATIFVYPTLAQADSPYRLLPSKQHKAGQLGFQSKWQSQWFQGDNGYLGGYWNASFSQELIAASPHLHSFSAVPKDIGLAAVLRYQRNDGTGFYAEAGTGPQYHSASYDLISGSQGSHFALNTLAGVGFVWKNGVDLGFKAVHYTRGPGGDGSAGGSRVSLGVHYHW
ncbi:MAG TPA: hypothetical protein DHV59_09620 [Oxalobacteraceae bacterium]|nr:hypothetical protein [Oxalobacteraceae bacterium]